MRRKSAAREMFAVAALLSCSAALTSSLASAQSGGNLEPVYGTAPRDDARAAAAFESIVPVLRHPRCMNCHSNGDYPRQGDDSHPHTMNVRRGASGFGVAGVRCSTCHQQRNTEGVHTPPGAPDWHLPSPEMPMIWEGISDRQICEMFKDPAKNGHKTIDGIVHHMNTPLVLWGWHPGGDRNPVPMSQEKFSEAVKVWAAAGAACPAQTTAPVSSGHR